MSKPKSKHLSKADKAILKHSDNLNAYVDRYLFVCEALNLPERTCRWLFNKTEQIDMAFKRIVASAR